MSSSLGPMTRGKKRKLCEEDEKPFEDPSIEFSRINLRLLEDLGKSQRKLLKDCKPSPLPTVSEILRRGAVEVAKSQQHASNRRKQPSGGPVPLDTTRIGGSMHILDFGPSYLYYGVVQGCAHMAIAKYNNRVKRIYKFVKINRVASAIVNGAIYEINFQAECPGDLATFDARVHVSRGGTKVISVWRKAQQHLAMVMGQQADIKTGKDVIKTYKCETSSGDASEISKKLREKVVAKKIKRPQCTRVVEITDEAADHGDDVLKQAISRRGAIIRGKQKELSPQDAAVVIQMSFRAYWIRRSLALKALRELAIAKTKMKELRGLFNNFTYRRHVARDAEERQRLSEKIIVLLLSVDAVEGADLMVRSAKKSMVDELEAMLDVVDPQPVGRSVSTRRTFDMPDAKGTCHNV